MFPVGREGAFTVLGRAQRRSSRAPQ